MILKTLITSILLLSITKYLSLEPSIFSTLPNKLLTFKYKGTTLFIIFRAYVIRILCNKYLFQLEILFYLF